MGTVLGTLAKRMLERRIQQSPQFHENRRKGWSGRVDSNHRPPGPEPERALSRTDLKTQYFQVIHVKAVLSKVVEIDYVVWSFGLADYRIIYNELE